MCQIPKAKEKTMIALTAYSHELEASQKIPWQLKASWVEKANKESHLKESKFYTSGSFTRQARSHPN